MIKNQKLSDVKKRLFGLLFVILLSTYFNFEQIIKINGYAEFFQFIILFLSSCIIYLIIFALCDSHQFGFLGIILLFLLFTLNALSSYTLHNFNVAINYEFYIDIFSHKLNNIVLYSESINDHFIMMIYLLLYLVAPLTLLLYLIKKKIVSYAYSKYNISYIILATILIYLLSNTFHASKYYLAKREFIDLVTYRFVPQNYVFGILKMIKRCGTIPKEERVKICTDARLVGVNNSNNKMHHRTVIFIMGESARADHFSIYGYERNTNPKLSKVKDLIVFRSFEACNTSTYRSVPCIFSRLNMYEFTLPVAQDNLLDVLNNLGIETYWFSTQDSYINTCNFIKNVKIELKSDEDLLKELKMTLKNNRNKTKLIVLHHNGSHHPYHINYKEKHEIFKPACKTIPFRTSCQIPDIVNSYDNTVVATDEFISNVIKIAKKYDDNSNNTVVIYTSDHGQSLGEDGIFTHGSPRIIAPKAQIEVPFFMWVPKQTAKNFNLDYTILLHNAKESQFTHDQIFDSILKLFSVEATCCGKDGDIFSIR